MSDRLQNLNNFIVYNNSTRKNGLLFNNKYDEPTYISIRAEFLCDAQYENGITKTNYNLMPNPLLDMDSAYSTYKYLNDSIGDRDRANLLTSLINALKDLSEYCPYYITSIDGINSLLDVDPKRGARIKSDAVITFKCIEGLDQRISAIKNIYKKIAWDDTYQRWILPDIMRWFKMNIYISEFRVFHTNEENKNTTSVANNIINDLKSTAEGLINSNLSINDFKKYNVYKFLNKRIPTTILECSMCEFDISDSFSHLSSITSSPKNNNLDNIEIKIKVGNIKEKTLYGLFNEGVITLDDDMLGKPNSNAVNEDMDLNVNFALRTNQLIEDLDKNNGKHDSYFSRLLKNTTKNALAYIKNEVKDQITSLINKEIIGGISLNDIRRAIKAENIFTMYNIFKSNADSIKKSYPELHTATNGKLDLEMFKGYLDDISKSEATNENDKLLKSLSGKLLEYGDAINAQSIDEYMNILNDVLNSVTYSKATTNTNLSKKILL